jgi:4-nitrophenyl phosphatase
MSGCGYLTGYLDRYDSFIFDCDGVLWNGKSPIHGSADAIAHLKEAGKQCYFLTNNSASSRTQYVAKFSSLGFGTIELDDISTSASAAAEYCSSQGITKVFVVGTEGLRSELEDQGIETVFDASGLIGMNAEEFQQHELVPGVEAVVVGFDTQFTFHKLCLASLYAQEGAKLVITNEDDTLSFGERQMPENGSTSAAIRHSLADSAGLDEAVVTGKPSALLLDTLVEKYDLDETRTLMCGDRLDTDIAFGRGRIDTLLVLTGIVTETSLGAALPTLEPINVPTYVAGSLRAAVSGALMVTADTPVGSEFRLGSV